MEFTNNFCAMLETKVINFSRTVRARCQRIKTLSSAFSAARDAPYAKARTTFVRDVQLARTVLSDQFKPAYHEQASNTHSTLL